jgi:hypothetical protein
MSNKSQPNNHSSDSDFDLVRVSKSKERVDLCSNTIRDYATKGLRLYRHGRSVFFSKSELTYFIKAMADKPVVVHKETPGSPEKSPCASTSTSAVGVVHASARQLTAAGVTA